MFFCKFRAFIVPLTQTLHRGAYFKADRPGTRDVEKEDSSPVGFQNYEGAHQDPRSAILIS